METSNIDTGGALGSGLSRRGFLGGLAATPVVNALGSSTAAAAAEGTGSGLAPKIERGGVRHFNAPRLTPGARLRLPAGIKAVPVEGFFENRPRVARTEYPWPHVPAADGEMVDASIIPERGAASRLAVLNGFKQGWYEVIHVDGSIDRVEWNAQKLPYLWLWSEFGASKDLPFMGQFFTLALEPFSRNPIS